MSRVDAGARSRSARRFWSGIAAALSACVLLGGGAVSAQPKGDATSKAKADKAPDKAKADKAKADKAPDKAAEAKPSEPRPAEPPQGGALPPGHPPLDDDEGGAGPDGQGQAGMPGMFNAPQNSVPDDPALPAGSIVVTIRDGEGKPIPRAPLTVAVQRSSIAKGDAPLQNLTRATDDQGTVRYDDQPVGTGATFRVSTQRGSASYEAPPFSLGDKVGKQVTVHAYEVTTNIDRTMVGMQGVVYVQLREDSLNVQQYFGVMNMGKTAWAPDDLVVALPEGFRAFNKQESGNDGRVEEAPKKGVAIRGTFAPGQHDLEFHYTVPLAGTERQTLRLELPPHFGQMRVMVEASKKMGLEVAGFPAAQRQTGRDGKKILVTERQARQAEGGLTSIELTLSGLPTQGPGRWIAVALGLAFVAGGVGYVARRRNTPGALDDDTRRDLREAQAALLDEIVALERAHKGGEVGPKSYERVRTALLDALARIVSMLEDAREAKLARRRPGQGRGAASAGA